MKKIIDFIKGLGIVNTILASISLVATLLFLIVNLVISKYNIFNIVTIIVALVTFMILMVLMAKKK